MSKQDILTAEQIKQMSNEEAIESAVHIIETLSMDHIYVVLTRVFDAAELDLLREKLGG